MKKEKHMPIESNANKATERASMVLTSSGLALTVAGTFNPIAGLAGAVLNIASLPFAVYNTSLVRKQLEQIIEEFNKLDTRLERLENINENQSTMLFLNEYKLLDYALKEKMLEKIQAYAKIFSEGVNNGTVLEENDLFDIQMDIINSLRTEDVVLLNQLFDFVEKEKELSYLSEFTKEEIDAFITANTSDEESANEYALRHLINLGLVKERLNTSSPQVDDGHLSFTDKIVSNYSLTQRCRMIRDIITK